MITPPPIKNVAEKSDTYMFGHRALPWLLFNEPEYLQPFLEENANDNVQALWSAYCDQWDVQPADREIDTRVFTNDEDGLAVIIDLPKPKTVPEPHAIVMVLKPVRAFFALELVSGHNKDQHERGSWVRMSSAGGDLTPKRVLAFLGEWTADGAHRNSGAIVGEVNQVLRSVSNTIGTSTRWTETTLPVRHDINSVAARVPEKSLAPEIASEIRKHVEGLASTNGDALELSTVSSKIATYLRDQRALHGDNSAEITIHTRHVVDLCIQAGDPDQAYDVAYEWVQLCLRCRGTRAPETRIAYTWLARAIGNGRTGTDEERQRRMATRLRMRKTLAGGMRNDLPFANDPDVTAES